MPAPAPPPPAALAAPRDSGSDKVADGRGVIAQDEQPRQPSGSVMRAAPKANAGPAYGGMASADAAAANRLDKPADLSDRLRAAAAAGRTGEVKTLLDQGAPLDAADGRGDTALIKAVRANQPVAAVCCGATGPASTTATTPARAPAAWPPTGATRRSIGRWDWSRSRAAPSLREGRRGAPASGYRLEAR